MKMFLQLAIIAAFVSPLAARANDTTAPADANGATSTETTTMEKSEHGDKMGKMDGKKMDKKTTHKMKKTEKKEETH